MSVSSRGSPVRLAFTLVELLVVIAIIAVLIGLLLPAVQKVREAAFRTQCQNNLKQIGLALQNYHSANDYFPPGESSYPNAPGWMAMILPYMEQNSLYQAVNFGEPYTDKVDSNNGVVGQTIVSNYICPSYPRSSPLNSQNGLAVADYWGFAGYTTNCDELRTQNPPASMSAGGFSNSTTPISILSFTDGTSNTLQVSEVSYVNNSSYGVWMSPYSWAVQNASAVNGTTFLLSTTSTQLEKVTSCPVQFRAAIYTRGASSYHVGGANAVFADGSVHFLTDGCSQATLDALCTRAGGDIVGPDAY